MTYRNGAKEKVVINFTKPNVFIKAGRIQAVLKKSVPQDGA